MMYEMKVKPLLSDRCKILWMILLGAGFYLFFLTLFSRSFADNDLWGYLAFGGVLVESGYFPFQDIFSYIPTKPIWVYHEWLTGWLFYIIYKYSGPAGLQLFRYAMALITLYLIYATALKKGGNPLTASMVLIPSMLLISFGYVPVRAQIFTYFFFILTLYILESARNTQKWPILLWLLPVQILWCNFHGGFVSGLGLIGLYVLGDGLSGKMITPLIIMGFLATLVTLVNPYGIQYWFYTIEAVTMPRPQIDEWMSIFQAIKGGFQSLPVLIFLFLVFLALLFFASCRERKLTDGLVLAVTIYLGCKHIRHNILFGIVFGAYMPILLVGCWTLWKKKNRFLTRHVWFPGILPAALLVSLFVLVNPSLSLTVNPSFTLLTPASLFPLGAVRWIQENQVRGNILPHFDWGEFIIWTCYPACRVAMDGRYETVYEDQASKEYFDFLTGNEKWHVFLSKYSHDMVLIKPNTRTFFLMLQEPSWRVAYSDAGCVLFIRNVLEMKGK